MGRPRVPAPPPPVAIPEVSEEAPEYAMRAARRRRGFERTLMMGELTPRTTGKKTVLG